MRFSFWKRYFSRSKCANDDADASRMSTYRRRFPGIYGLAIIYCKEILKQTCHKHLFANLQHLISTWGQTLYWSIILYTTPSFVKPSLVSSYLGLPLLRKGSNISIRISVFLSYKHCHLTLNNIIINLRSCTVWCAL